MANFLLGSFGAPSTTAATQVGQALTDSEARIVARKPLLAAGAAERNDKDQHEKYG